MSKVMATLTIAIATIMALGTSSAEADDFADLRGVWTGKYLAVSPPRNADPGPRFNNAEWMLEIKEQNENVFWGKSKWRVKGRDEWNEKQATGSVSLKAAGPNLPWVNIVEVSLKPGGGVTGLIDGTLKDGKLYVNFRGLRAGTSFSAVLKKSSQ